MTVLHQRLLDEVAQPFHIWAREPAAGQLARREAALRAVVELHAPIGPEDQWHAGLCGHCAGKHPCSTIKAIAEELGVETP